MGSIEERMQILKMIQEGKITAEEGARLLEVLERVNRPAAPKTSEIPGPSRGPARWMRVRVTDTKTGKARVNVRMPVSLISSGVKMGARFSPEVEGLDVDQLLEFINAGGMGQVVDVMDDEDGEHIEVFIE
ncbi:MAG: hypothetical protein ABFD44_00800 [Anaerolineaceae bacterium]